MVNPGGRVVGRSLSEWTTRSTLRRTSRKQSLTEAPLYLQLCDREKRHLLGRVLRTRTDYCLQLTADRPHSLVSLQSVLQLFGEQALLSNLEKKAAQGVPQTCDTECEGACSRECGLTLDRAVSRILSPVVDMATETERSSRGLISDLQPQVGPDGRRSRAQYQTFGELIWLLAFPPSEVHEVLAPCGVLL